MHDIEAKADRQPPRGPKKSMNIFGGCIIRMIKTFAPRLVQLRDSYAHGDYTEIILMLPILSIMKLLPYGIRIKMNNRRIK